MGIEKLWKNTRTERAMDSEVQKALEEEWKRVRESWGRAGNQTKEACTTLIYNTTVGIFAGARNGKQKKSFDPAGNVLEGAVDSTGETLALVGRILLATGRTTKWGIRNSLKI